MCFDCVLIKIEIASNFCRNQVGSIFTGPCSRYAKSSLETFFILLEIVSSVYRTENKQQFN